ncbi:hypothetical protein FB474_3336 [Oryzihumus leptocrescens]|uniref:Uncharacterized protein n=4 Tax=Oryzihumus leptocrescens TaxID=297536 RepID=A0A542ZNI7_9MICO|nr:hypothetical protein FB474_3336 [Oryzihumus leptocrescens]
MGQLWRAMEAARSSGDRATRARAGAKVERWQAVLSGMATGHLAVGSRTPVADTPAWVTLEVVPGGFATGRFVAEAPLDAAECERLASLPADVPGTTDRERLNLWYLSDEGQRELLAAVASTRFQVVVPEQAALLVVAWLLENDHAEPALDLVAELRPLMHRLRFTPTLVAVPRPAGVAVRLEPVATVAEPLRAAATPEQIAMMGRTLHTWHPLYDRLVALWCETVDGELPTLDPNGRVTGGWPCQVWPSDWLERRRQWLADYAAADAQSPGGRHRHPRSNFARLRTTLDRVDGDATLLAPRDVGWVRRALANTTTAHGAPGSERRAALRVAQAAIAAAPTHAAIAHVVAARLDRHPADGGLPALAPIAQDVRPGESLHVAPGTAVPAHIIRKVMRALEAPVEDLVGLGVITSGEVLARVLPQISSQVLAANIADPDLAAVYAQTYAAFRRRRSLLLLNLEHQVQFDELPWVGALSPFRTRTREAADTARQTLSQTTLLTMSAFPHAILPNPLVREMGALAAQAEVKLPLVEEVAADIFTGTFTVKWRHSARVASGALDGTLYARYYDLPAASTWEAPAPPPSRRWSPRRWGKEIAEDFAQLCRVRAVEAGDDQRRRGFVARNGAVLEQSQILTTHNLVQLVHGLDLDERLVHLAPDLAERSLTWVVQRQSQPWREWHSTLQMLKNTAYAWRQAVFYLSFCPAEAQLRAIDQFMSTLPAEGPAAGLRAVADGLAHVARGGRFDERGFAVGGTGRRFLGWSVGRHWLIPNGMFERASARVNRP